MSTHSLLLILLIFQDYSSLFSLVEREMMWSEGISAEKRENCNFVVDVLCVFIVGKLQTMKNSRFCCQSWMKIAERNVEKNAKLVNSSRTSIDEASKKTKLNFLNVINFPTSFPHPADLYIKQMLISTMNFSPRNINVTSMILRNVIIIIVNLDVLSHSRNYYELACTHVSPWLLPVPSPERSQPAF